MSQLEQCFPALLSTPWRITSPKDIGYNCIAWAAEDMSVWWEPDPQQQLFWPPTVPREFTLRAFVEVYSQLGYERCLSNELQPGLEKIAIFVDTRNRPTHAARQLPSGKWTSKLGQSEDIEHELSALEGTQYGSVAMIMKRPYQPHADRG